MPTVRRRSRSVVSTKPQEIKSGFNLQIGKHVTLILGNFRQPMGLRTQAINRRWMERDPGDNLAKIWIHTPKFAAQAPVGPANGRDNWLSRTRMVQIGRTVSSSMTP